LGGGDKGPQRLLRAASRAARVKIVVSNIPKSLCNFLYRV